MRAQTLRVFVDDDGGYGNPVGIFIDEDNSVDTETRIRFAAKLGYSESVFINSIARREIRFYTAQQEISFAGHAAVGAAWYLASLSGNSIDSMEGRDGTIRIDGDATLTWVISQLQTTPPWWHEFVSEDYLDQVTATDPELQGFVQMWTWLDEESGLVRSRTFAPAWGIPEDEANGSGCMRLAAALGRSLTITHGAGSVIHARPAGAGYAAVGGRVSSDGELDLA